MKKTIFAIILGVSVICVAATAQAIEPSKSAQKTDEQKAAEFNEGDFFVNVDVKDEMETAISKHYYSSGIYCWNWYYRPTTYYYTWRPVYYRPYYCYYRYYTPCYNTHFTWTTISCAKAVTNGAMVDSEPASDSPLAKKGVRKGDIIMEIDGKPIKNLSDLANVTAETQIKFHKGSDVKFAGNLLKQTDDNFKKQIKADEMQEVEAGKLLSQKEVAAGNYNMYNMYDKFGRPRFGIQAAENGGQGVKITNVLAGLPGEKTGFEKGDVILEINGNAINSEKDYSEAIDKAGETIRVKLLDCRSNQTVETDVTLSK